MKLVTQALMIASVLVIAGCSQESDADRTVQSATTAMAPIIPAVGGKHPITAGTAASAGSVAEAPVVDDSNGDDSASQGPALTDLLKHADFAAAYMAMDGVKGLPKWVRACGDSSSHKVTVGGKSLLGISDCNPDECILDRIALLYDEKTHEIWGVHGLAKDFMMDGPVKSTDKLTWLGQPDDQLKAALKEELYGAEGSEAAPAAGTPTADASVSVGPDLFDLLERADVAAAFKALPNGSKLPSWVREGGPSAAASNVTVDGRTLLIAEGCKTHECGRERIVMLYDEQTHGVWAVYASQRVEGPGDDVSDYRLTWFGQPNDSIKAVMMKQFGWGGV